MKTITIIQNDDKTMSCALSDSFSVEEITNMLTTAQLTLMNRIIEQVPEKHRQEAKEHFFDMYNLSASTLLATFIPDKDLRPHLTEEAILELENRKMAEVVKLHAK